MRISVGQALLLLIDHYKNDTAQVNVLKSLYLNGVVSPEDRATLNRFLRDPSLSSYEVSSDPSVINEDPSRRYFESHLAFESLRGFISTITIDQLNQHKQSILEMSPEEKYTETIKKALEGVQAGKNQEAEYADAIREINNKNQRMYLDFSEEEREKLSVMMQACFLGVVNVTFHNDELPMNIYGRGVFSQIERGREKKEDVDKTQGNVQSHHAGLMKSYMPLSHDDVLFRDNPYELLRPADQSGYNEWASFIAQLFKTETNIFSCSISGTLLCQLRIMIDFAKKNQLQFASEDQFKQYIGGFISLLLYQSGGHSIYEFSSLLSLPEVIAQLKEIYPEYSGLSINQLFKENNEQAFDATIQKAIDYNRQIIRRAEMHEQVRQEVGQQEPTKYSTYEATYIPEAVSKSDMKENGRVLSNKEIAKIEQAFKDGRIKPGQRISKKVLLDLGLPYRYSLIAREMEGGLHIFAIYSAVLGEGAFGKVKVVQDVTTGTFYAYKTQSSSSVSKNEREILEFRGELIDEVGYKPASEKGQNRYGAQATSLTLSLAQGVRLSKVKASSLSQQQKLNIVGALISEVVSLNESGIIHRDLKDDNCLYDELNNKLTIIDFGTSLFSDNSGQAIATLAGTPTLLPIDMRKAIYQIKNETDEQKKELLASAKYTFDEKIDVYTLGIMIGKWLSLTNAVTPAEGVEDLPHYEIKSFESTLNKNNSISDPAMRKEVISFLQAMTHADAECRPNLQEVQQFFARVCLSLEKKSQEVFRVGLVDIHEYQSLSNQDKVELMRSLIRCDTIQFVSSGDHMDDVMLREIKKDFESFGFRLPQVAYFADLPINDLISNIVSNEADRHPSKRFMYATKRDLSYEMRDQLREAGVELAPMKKASPSVKADSTVKSMPFKLMCSQLSPDDIAKHGLLMEPKSVHAIKELINSNVMKTKDGQNIVLTKEQLAKHGISSKNDIFISSNQGQLRLFLCYSSMSHYKKLKSVQDLDTGEFFNMSIHEKPRRGVPAEIDRLGMMGRHMSTALVDSPPQEYKGEYGHSFYFVIEPMHDSLPLSEFSSDGSARATHNEFDVAIRVVTQLQMIHQKYISGRLSPNSFSIDPASNDICFSALDSITAIEKETGMAASIIARNKTHYMAPEVYFSAEQFVPSVSPKADVFSAAVIIAERFGMIKVGQDGRPSLVSVDDVIENEDAVIKDADACRRLITLFEAMMADSPVQRPTMNEALSTLNEISNSFKVAYPKRVAVVDALELARMDKQEKNQLINELYSYDDVKLIYPDVSVNQPDVQRLMLELVERDIHFDINLVYGATNVAKLLQGLDHLEHASFLSMDKESGSVEATPALDVIKKAAAAVQNREARIYRPAPGQSTLASSQRAGAAPVNTPIESRQEHDAEQVKFGRSG